MKSRKTNILGSLMVVSLTGVFSAAAMAQEAGRPVTETVTRAVFVSPAFVSPDSASSELSSTDEYSGTKMEEFEALIEQIESEHGPFDYRLNEPLQSAGSALENRGEFAQALRLYERALHVTRINSGLYSEDQIGIVEKLINSNIALENWGVVDNHFRYLHLLYTRLYKKDSSELQRGLAQISDWHVLAINNDLGTDRIDHLREANKLFRQRLTLIEGQLPDDDPVIHTLRYNIAVTQYHLRLVSGGSSNEAIFDRLEEQYEEQLAVLD